MTAQFPDLVVHEGLKYSLCGVDGESLFDPAEAGLQTPFTSTACWRGYVATYGTAGGLLTVRSLAVGKNAKLDDRPVVAGDVVLGGTVAPGDGNELLIEPLALPVDFSGSLLIGRGFVEETYVHMGFGAGWKYEQVLDLRLESGQVREVSDRSGAMADLRTRIVSGTTPDPDGDRGGEGWIRRTFSLDYRRSGLD